MTATFCSQELVQKNPGGESEALGQPEEAALFGLTSDQQPLMCGSEVLFFEYKPCTAPYSVQPS